jgi:hypothetical protein
VVTYDIEALFGPGDGNVKQVRPRCRPPARAGPATEYQDHNLGLFALETLTVPQTREGWLTANNRFSA